MKFLYKITMRLSIALRYLFSGGTAAFVNLAILYLLADIIGVWYLSASVAAFSLAFIVSFTLQKFITFNDNHIHIAKRQFYLYMTVTVMNLCLNALLMYTLTDGVGIYHIYSQIIVSGLIAISSFFVYRHYIFHGSKLAFENSYLKYYGE